jgi:spore germination protein KB
MNLYEYSEMLLGKWMGKILSLLIIFFFLIIASTVLVDLGNFMATYIMPNTPIQAHYIIFTIIVIMGTRLGFEVIARSADILFPWALFLLSILIFTVLPEVHFENIQPAFKGGLKPILILEWHTYST